MGRNQGTAWYQVHKAFPFTSTSTVKEVQEQKTNTNKTRHDSKHSPNLSQFKLSTGKPGCRGLQVTTKEQKDAGTNEHITA